MPIRAGSLPCALPLSLSPRMCKVGIILLVYQVVVGKGGVGCGGEITESKPQLHELFHNLSKWGIIPITVTPNGIGGGKQSTHAFGYASGYHCLYVCVCVCVTCARGHKFCKFCNYKFCKYLMIRRKFIVKLMSITFRASPQHQPLQRPRERTLQCVHMTMYKICRSKIF